MKIFKDHEKMKTHYEAVIRMRKRYLNLFILLFIIISIFTIIYFVKKQFFVGLFLSLFVFFLLICSVLMFYRNIYLPRKKPVFNEIVSDLYKNQIISDLSKKGLLKENLDTILDPHGYVNIAYNYDNNLYYMAEISLTTYSFYLKLKDNMFQIDSKIFDKYIQKKDYRYKKITKIGKETKEELYSLFIDYINDNKEINDLANRCKSALKENKKIFG
ncbi:MAG: hypothetical protein ACI35S_04330 [Anaeroplasma sp.]